jgi:Condensation domain
VAAEMRISGPLDVDAMRAALQHVVMGNEILRTTFIERDGRPLQVVGMPRPIEIPVIELGDDPNPDPTVTEILRRDALEPFDLERGPLLRMRLVRVGEDDHRLLRLTHHIVSDGFSWRAFFADVARGYEAHRRGEPKPTITDRLQYADFAAWERERLRPDGALYGEQVDWWRRAFEPERPPLRLPFARPTPVRQAPAADGVIYWGIEPGESAALDHLARRSGATPYTVRLALFAALLGLETGQDEITVGTYAMNRPVAETQSMFGFFSNPVTLLLRFDPKLSFRRWVARVRRVVIEVKARGEIPHERLSEELHRSATPPPEIKAMFVLRTRWPPLRFAGLEIGPPRLTVVGMPWGFSFNVDPNRESEWCMAMFDARIHDPDSVCGFIERYRHLVRRILERPRRRLRRLRA